VHAFDSHGAWINMQSHPIRVLLIDDDEDDYLIVRELLSDISSIEFILKLVSDYGAALDAILSGEFDVCLLDYRLKERNGLELMQEAVSRGAMTPIVFLTGYEGYGLDLEAMSKGAADWLTKDELSATLLGRSIRNAMERQRKSEERTAELIKVNAKLTREVEERKRAEDELRVSLRFLEIVHEHTDISEHKPAELALKESEERARMNAARLQATLDAAPAIIFMAHDPDCRIISGNRSARKLCKVDEWTNMSKAGDEPGRVSHFRFFKDGRELTPEELPIHIVAKSGREISNCALECVLDDGAVYSLLGNVTPVLDSKGNPKGAIGAFIDITELKQAENALRESENRLNLAIEQAGMGTWDTDLCTGQTFWSQNHFHLLGYEPNPDGEATFEMWRSMVHPCDLDRVMQEFERARREHDLYAPEHRIVRAGTGEAVWLTVFGRFLYNGKGDAKRFTGIFFDSTERKRLEEDRQKALACLHQAQKVEAIGTLAGGIAHDFNNLLQPIIGYTEMALNELSVSSPLRDGLEQVFNASLRAKELVRQILAVSHSTHEQQRIPTDISSIIKEALKLLRSSFPASIEIRQNIRVGVALADPTQIHQVLMNLCTNAAHAMDDKGILEVNLSPVDLSESDLADQSIVDLTPGPYLRLTVSDTGSGIDAETMERIFDPYFTTKEKGKGSGLGLAVVKGIVKRHQGAIAVRSEPGKGTTFSIYIPTVDSESEATMQVDDPLSRGSESILLLDDEQTVVEMGTRLLECLGYKVTSQTESVKALEVFRSSPDDFDLVITDYTMPKLTGLDFAREVLRIRPDIPVLLCTGFSEKITPDSVKGLGMGLLMKPYGMREISEMVRKTLDTRKGG